MKLFKNDFTAFIVKGVVFYIIWEILYRNFIIYSDFSHGLVEQITNASRFVLDIFYNKVHVEPVGKLFVDGNYAVYVSPDCNALDFIGAFLAFLFAYPAKILSKVVFGSIMIVLINVFNIMRVSLLAATVMHAPNMFDFNHHYLFNIAIYVLMILSIIYWVKNHVTPEKSPAE